MKIAFVHDHIFYKKDNKVYSRGGLPYNVWSRYLNVFENIIVMGRVGEIGRYNIENLIESSGPNVEFYLNTNYKNPKQFFLQQKLVSKQIKELVSNVDACIIRLPSILGILTAKECIRQKKPWAVEVVACCWDSFWNYGSINGKIIAPIMYYLNKYYIKNANYAIYVSREFLQRRYPCRNITNYASNVNIQNLDDNIINTRLEKIKNIDKKNIVYMGIIGSLDIEYKGHRTAIKALKDLKDKGYNVVLRCLGSGNKEKWINLAKKLNVENCIEFCGILPSGKPVLEWIDNIDIFIMPSLQEGLPRSMVEAMSRACPVIGAKTGGIPELLDKEFIIKPKDYKQLSNLVINFIENKELSKNVAIRNYNESKKYLKNKIELNRNVFLNDFRNYVIDKNKI